MDPITLGLVAAGIGSGASASSAIVGDVLNWYQSNWQREWATAENQKDRDFNALEAQKNRDFQALMSNTAYQRQVADMKAAGINPAMVSANSGASVPSGYAASTGSSRGYQLANMHGIDTNSALGRTILKTALSSDDEVFKHNLKGEVRRFAKQLYSSSYASAKAIADDFDEARRFKPSGRPEMTPEEYYEFLEQYGVDLDKD